MALLDWTPCSKFPIVTAKQLRDRTYEWATLAIITSFNQKVLEKGQTLFEWLLAAKDCLFWGLKFHLQTQTKAHSYFLLLAAIIHGQTFQLMLKGDGMELVKTFGEDHLVYLGSSQETDQ